MHAWTHTVHSYCTFTHPLQCTQTQILRHIDARSYTQTHTHTHTHTNSVTNTKNTLSPLVCLSVSPSVSLSLFFFVSRLSPQGCKAKLSMQNKTDWQATLRPLPNGRWPLILNPLLAYSNVTMLFRMRLGFERGPVNNTCYMLRPAKPISQQFSAHSAVRLNEKSLNVYFYEMGFQAVAMP